MSMYVYVQITTSRVLKQPEKLVLRWTRVTKCVCRVYQSGVHET